MRFTCLGLIWNVDGFVHINFSDKILLVYQFISKLTINLTEYLSHS